MARPRGLLRALALAAGLAAGADSQEPAFLHVAEPLPPPVLEVAEPGGTLRAEGDRLVRVRDGRGSPLRCAQTAGLGRVLGLAQDRSGTTWIAAERGLFLARPESDAVDALYLRDGVPRGAPVAIAHDGGRRLWVATQSELGCIDCAHGFGRTRAAGSDGLPKGPFTGLCWRDGELRLAAADGVHAYRPRTGCAAPALGEPLAGGVARARHGEPLSLSLGEVPGITYRYRLADRHLLQPLAGARAEIPGLKPTVREIDVYAVDPDLDLSPPLRIPVAIACPPALRVRPLLTGAALGALALLAVGVAVAWRRGGRGATSRAALGTFLVVVLGLQVVAGFLGHGRAWPFMAFTMYAETYRENDLVYKPRLVGVGVGGEVTALSPTDLGFMSDGDWQPLIPLMFGGPEHAARYRVAVAARHPGLALAGLEVRAERVRLTREGPLRVPALVLWRLDL